MGDHQILLGILAVLVSVLVHVMGLILLAGCLKRLGRWMATWRRVLTTMVLLVVASLSIIGLHLVEALGWALLYRWLGEFDHLEQALYFSIVTATTLGYGDLTLSEAWQLLGTFEAMQGLILFGASTAFFLAVMRSFFEPFVVPGESKQS